MVTKCSPISISVKWWTLGQNSPTSLIYSTGVVQAVCDRSERDNETVVDGWMRTSLNGKFTQEVIRRGIKNNIVSTILPLYKIYHVQMWLQFQSQEEYDTTGESVVEDNWNDKRARAGWSSRHIAHKASFGSSWKAPSYPLPPSCFSNFSISLQCCSSISFREEDARIVQQGDWKDLQCP